MMKDLATVLGQGLFSSDDENKTITDAILKVAYQLKSLGNGDAATPMGAIEVLGAVHKEGMESIASSLSDIADAIRDVSVSLDMIKDKMPEES